MFEGRSRRFKIESILAAVSGLLGVVTLFWHEWLEAFGWDPDHGNGSVEWLIVGVLLLTALVLGLLARRDSARESLSPA